MDVSEFNVFQIINFIQILLIDMLILKPQHEIYL